jgi:hypothetical protein
MNDPEQPEYGASGAYTVNEDGYVRLQRDDDDDDTVAEDRMSSRSVPSQPVNSRYMSESDLENVTCDVILAGWVFHRTAIWSGLPYSVRWIIYSCLSVNPWGYAVCHDVGISHLICPDALVRYYYHTYLNYQRLRPRGLASRFENVDVMIPELVFGWARREGFGIRSHFEHEILTPHERLRMRDMAREGELRMQFSQMGQSRHPALQQQFMSRGRLHREHRYDSRRLRRIREAESESPFQNFLGVTPAPDPPSSGRGRARPHTESRPTLHDRCNRDVRGRIVAPSGQQQQPRPRPKNVEWQKTRHLGRRHKGK